MKKLLCKKHCEDDKKPKKYYFKDKTYDFEDKRADELLRAYDGEYFEFAKEEKEVKAKKNEDAK